MFAAGVVVFTLASAASASSRRALRRCSPFSRPGTLGAAVGAGGASVSASGAPVGIGEETSGQAPREAAEARQAASVAEAQAERQRAERVRARGRGRAQVRREKLRALARLLASGSTRRAAARALGVDERTIRRWTKLPGFAAELEKARERRERELERLREGG